LSEENKAAIRRMYEALNAGDLTAMASALADDMVEHEELPGLTPDKEGVIQFFRGAMAGVEGFRMNIEEIMAEGDRVSVRATVSGKHTGELMGIPATGKDLNVPLADYFRLQGGKVAEHWGVMDSGTMLMQMGIVKMPG
jgi:steroid delta-isomerase-like uncharacterized protein